MEDHQVEVQDGVNANDAVNGEEQPQETEPVEEPSTAPAPPSPNPNVDGEIKTYRVIAEDGLFKRGKLFEQGDEIELEEKTGERFKELGEVEDA